MKVNPKVKENQASFWHAFAYLAVNGKRNQQDYQIAMLTDPPEDEQVVAIVQESKQLSKEIYVAGLRNA